MKLLFILLNLISMPIILSSSNFSPTNDITINNNLGNYRNPRNLAGSVSITLTPTDTATMTYTRTITATGTGTRSRAPVSVTASGTGTRSRAPISVTATGTRSRAGESSTATGTATRSRAPISVTATGTATRSRAPVSVTATGTRSRAGASSTATATRSRAPVSVTPTITGTATRSRAPVSVTATGTLTRTGTVTTTRTATNSRAPGSLTSTITATRTDTRTATPSISLTKTATASISSSKPPSASPGSLTPTATATVSSSVQLSAFQILIPGQQVLGASNMITSSLQNFAGPSAVIKITSINWLNNIFTVNGYSNDAQQIGTQYTSSIQYQQLESQLTNSGDSSVQSTTQQPSVALPVGIGVGGVVIIALIILVIVFINSNSKKVKLMSKINQLEKKTTIEPQQIAINYNDYESEVTQKVINPFQRRNSIGSLQYETINVEPPTPMLKSTRHLELRQSFAPIKTNTFKPVPFEINNKPTKILGRTISSYSLPLPPPIANIPPPPPLDINAVDEKLSEQK